MTYFIGIDIAKFKHDCFIMDQDGTVIRNSFSFKNNKAGFDQLLSILNSLDPSHEKRKVLKLPVIMERISNFT